MYGAAHCDQLQSRHRAIPILAKRVCKHKVNNIARPRKSIALPRIDKLQSHTRQPE